MFLTVEHLRAEKRLFAQYNGSTSKPQTPNTSKSPPLESSSWLGPGRYLLPRRWNARAQRGFPVSGLSRLARPPGGASGAGEGRRPGSGHLQRPRVGDPGRREGVGCVGLRVEREAWFVFCSGAEEVLRSLLRCFPCQEEMTEFHPSWTRLWGAARGRGVGEGQAGCPSLSFTLGLRSPVT